jgi:hypothetical protein
MTSALPVAGGLPGSRHTTTEQGMRTTSNARAILALALMAVMSACSADRPTTLEGTQLAVVAG